MFSPAEPLFRIGRFRLRNIIFNTLKMIFLSRLRYKISGTRPEILCFLSKGGSLSSYPHLSWSLSAVCGRIISAPTFLCVNIYIIHIKILEMGMQKNKCICFLHSPSAPFVQLVQIILKNIVHFFKAFQEKTFAFFRSMCYNSFC